MKYIIKHSFTPPFIPLDQLNGGNTLKTPFWAQVSLIFFNHIWTNFLDVKWLSQLKSAMARTDPNTWLPGSAPVFLNNLTHWPPEAPLTFVWCVAATKNRTFSAFLATMTKIWQRMQHNQSLWLWQTHPLPSAARCRFSLQRSRTKAALPTHRFIKHTSRLLTCCLYGLRMTCISHTSVWASRQPVTQL